MINIEMPSLFVSLRSNKFKQNNPKAISGELLIDLEYNILLN